METLYKKKLIRDFVSLYKQQQWEPLIVSLIEYGIMSLKTRYHNIGTFSLDDVQGVVEKLKVDLNIVERKKVIPKSRSNSKISRNDSIISTNSKSKQKLQSREAVGSATYKKKDTTTNSSKSKGDFSKSKNNSRLNPALKSTLLSAVNSKLESAKVSSGLTAQKNRSESKSKFQALELRQIEKIKNKRLQQEQNIDALKELQEKKILETKLKSTVNAKSKIKQQIENDRKIFSKIKDSSKLNQTNSSLSIEESHAEMGWSPQLHTDELTNQLHQAQPNTSNMKANLKEQMSSTLMKTANSQDIYNASINSNTIINITPSNCNYTHMKNINSKIVSKLKLLQPSSNEISGKLQSEFHHNLYPSKMPCDMTTGINSSHYQERNNYSDLSASNISGINSNSNNPSAINSNTQCLIESENYIPLKNPLINKILSNTGHFNNPSDNSQASFDALSKKKDLRIDTNSQQIDLKKATPFIDSYEYEAHHEAQKLESRLEQIRNKISNIDSNYETSDSNKNIVYNSIKPMPSSNSVSETKHLAINHIKSLSESQEPDEDEISEDNLNKYNYVYMDE